MPGGYAVRDARGMIVAHIFGRDQPRVGCLTMGEAKEMALALAKAGGAGLIGAPVTRQQKAVPTSAAVGDH